MSSYVILIFNLHLALAINLSIIALVFLCSALNSPFVRVGLFSQLVDAGLEAAVAEAQPNKVRTVNRHQGNGLQETLLIINF